MRIEITSKLGDTAKTLEDDDNELKSDFIPRVNDIIYFKDYRYIVDRIIIDYDYEVVSVWVKDCPK